MISLNIHNIISITMEATRLHKEFSSRTLVIKTKAKYDDFFDTHRISLYSEFGKHLVPHLDGELIRYPESVEKDDAPDQTAA